MEVIFTWIGGATFILSIGNLHIAVDPVLCPKGTTQDYFWFTSKRTEEPVYTDHDFESVDLWLITHRHEDHLDSIGLSKISPSATIVSNPNASKILRQNGKENLSVLTWGQQKEMDIKGYHIHVKAVPAVHGINPLSALFAGKGNGYYVTISRNDEKISFYLTGDTVYKNKIIKALQNKEINIMIPNMGAAKQGSWIMTLTLNAEMLKKMIAKLHPRLVIPVHFGTFEHYKEPVEKLREIPDKRIKILTPDDKVHLQFENE